MIKFDFKIKFTREELFVLLFLFIIAVTIVISMVVISVAIEVYGTHFCYPGQLEIVNKTHTTNIIHYGFCRSA